MPRYMCTSIKRLVMIATVLGAAGMLVLIAVGLGRGAGGSPTRDPRLT